MKTVNFIPIINSPVDCVLLTEQGITVSHTTRLAGAFYEGAYQ